MAYQPFPSSNNNNGYPIEDLGATTSSPSDQRDSSFMDLGRTAEVEQPPKGEKRDRRHTLKARLRRSTNSKAVQQSVNANALSGQVATGSMEQLNNEREAPVMPKRSLRKKVSGMFGRDKKDERPGTSSSTSSILGIPANGTFERTQSRSTMDSASSSAFSPNNEQGEFQRSSSPSRSRRSSVSTSVSTTMSNASRLNSKRQEAKSKLPKPSKISFPGPSSFSRRRSSKSSASEVKSHSPGHSGFSPPAPPLPVRSSSIPISDFGDEGSCSQGSEVPELITTSATPIHPSIKSSRDGGLASPAPPGQQGLSTRVSTWFSNILPVNPGDTSPTPRSNPPSHSSLPPPINLTRPGSAHSSTGPTAVSHISQPRSSFSSVSADLPSSASINTNNITSPPRRAPSSATSFFQAARQKAVGVGRWVIDGEAMPDGCTDPIWILGVEHRFDQGDSGKEMDTEPEGSEQGSWGRKDSAGLLSSPTVKRMGIRRAGSPSPSMASTTTSSTLFGGRNVFGMGGLGSPGRKGRVVSTGPEELEYVGGGGEGSPARAGRGLGVKGKEKDRMVAAGTTWPDEFLLDYKSIIWCTYRSQYAPISSLPPELFLPNRTAYLAARLPPLPADLEESLLNLSISQTGNSGSGSGTGRSGWSWVTNMGAGMGIANTAPVEKGLTSDAGWGCMLRTGQSLLANALIRRHLGRAWRRPYVIGPTGTPLFDFGNQLDFAAYVEILSWFMDDPATICPFSVHRMALIGKQLGKEIGEWFGPSTAAGAIKTLTNAFPVCGIAVSAATDGIVFKSDIVAASKVDDGAWADVIDELPWPHVKQEPVGAFGSKAVLVLVNVRLGTSSVNPIYYDSLKTLFRLKQSVGIAGGRPSSSYYFIGYQADSLFYLDPHFTRPAVLVKTPAAERTVQPEDLPDGSAIPIPITRNTGTQGPHGRETTPTAGDRTDHAAWLASAYSAEQLSSYHCEKVRKMPMSSLDPSMLMGFLIEDEADWEEFSTAVNGLRHKIFAIQDQPPTWGDDDDYDAAVESMSETDDGFDELQGRSESASSSERKQMDQSQDFILTNNNAPAPPFGDDDLLDMADSPPITPIRSRLRPSATDSTLNARAVMSSYRDRDNSLERSEHQRKAELGSSTVILGRRDLSTGLEEAGVMVEPSFSAASDFGVGSLPEEETLTRRMR